MYLCNLWILALSLHVVYAKVIQERDENISHSKVCNTISKSISSPSRLYRAGSTQYTKDITSWSDTNTQRAACTVEPRTSKDVATIIKILGSTKTPFAVKGGGHSPNPGFSSTKGVLISMRQFSQVKYNAKSKTVVIGAGLIWDDVYKALMPHKVSVLGGRVSGVGVAGFLLGGGYSFKSNEHGLAFDTVTAYELVTPTGDIIVVSKDSNPDLLFALKGGMNNFGIVTKFTMKTFPQTDVWGGILVYSQESLPNLTVAIAAFNSQVNDPKASILTSLIYAANRFVIVQVLFYDAPSPPTGLFDDFTNIQAIQADVSRRSLLSLIKSIPASVTDGRRNLFSTTPILLYTPTIINAIANETTFWGQKLAEKSAVVISYNIEPFSQAVLSHNTTRTAYPADRSLVMSPFNINYAWELATFDSDFYAAVEQSKIAVQRALLLNGQLVSQQASSYPNYAMFDTPLNQLYGGANVKHLKKLKKRVDPGNVMGLTGGFKL